VASASFWGEKNNIMPTLPSSRNLSISRKLGKIGKNTPSIDENLKLQRAAEAEALAQANEEHVNKIELLEKEVEQCRAEIESLTAQSDEHMDTLMPLPSPSRTLKFVKNTQSRTAKRGQGMTGENAAIMVAQLKQLHKRSLAKATEAHTKKVQLLKKEVHRYKAETEALKASAAREAKQGCDGAGVNMKTGVAERDKENVRQKRVSTHKHIIGSSVLKNVGEGKIKSKTKAPNQFENSENKFCDNERLDSDDLRAKYERLFSESYQYEKDPAYEQALALGNGGTNATTTTNSAEIKAMCTDLTNFMSEIRKECGHI